MWFKNLIIYRFTEPFRIKAAELETKLETKRFRPCGKTEHLVSGWAPPVAEGSTLVHESNGCLVFALCQEERLLPPSVIREAVNEKVFEVEQKQERKVFRKEKEQIKGEVTLSLLPRAFTRKKMFYVYIDLVSGSLVVDASSFRIAENITSLLRKSIGSLPVSLPEVNVAPATLMTQWLKKMVPMPGHFSLTNECELTEPGENGSIVQCKRQELVSEEIAMHLDSGKLVSRLGIEWKDALRCVLHDDLCIRRLRFSDALLGQQEHIDARDKAARFDADFTLMALTLRDFIKDVYEVFDGDGPQGVSVQENNSSVTLSVEKVQPVM